MMLLSSKAGLLRLLTKMPVSFKKYQMKSKKRIKTGNYFDFLEVLSETKEIFGWES